MTAKSFAEVIGDPIEHSRSPEIHAFWLQQSGIEADYRRRRVPRGGLDSYLSEVRGDPAWRGCNVTMPLKMEAVLAADQASDQAVAAAAANLLIPRDGQLVAGNTDVQAMASLLDRIGKDGAAMGSVTVFGNGGAARAALVALRLAGVKKVRIQARDMAAARKLCVEFDADSNGPLTDAVTNDGLINATPLGMAGNECLNCDLAGLPASGWVVDLVSAPAETPLIAAARARGLRTVDGLTMLVEQAAGSFEQLFGVKPPRDGDGELMLRLRR